jgi:hypothetical protein
METKNTIQLPEEIYNAVREQAVKQQKTPDALVTEWLHILLNADIDIKFASQLNDFIDQYRPTLEALGKDPYVGS